MLVKKFGVSLEENLLKVLDSLVKDHNLPNRSQAIRFLIRKNILEKRWEENKEVVGCIVIIYNHHKRDLINKSLNLQHSFQDLILAAQHVHLNSHNCLEMIALKGKAKDLKELADKLIGLKGIKHGELVMSGVGSVE